MIATVVSSELNGAKPTTSIKVVETALDTKEPHDETIVTINDLLLNRLETLPDEPLVGYPGGLGGLEYVYYTPRDLDRFAEEAVRDLIENGLPLNNSADVEERVIALLGPSNLDYVVSLFALSRMGYGVLLLSTRLATEAYVSLLDKTNCRRILGSSSTAKSTTAIQSIRKVKIYTIPDHKSYDRESSSPIVSKQPNTNTMLSKRTAIIIHSSGSTGLPKPIFQTHEACLSNYASDTGYRAFVTLPLFHNHGLSTFFRAFYKGKPISLYNASLPLTASSLVQAMESVQPESFHGVPYALKLLAESERGIEALRKCKLVLFGGSSCPDELGDKLVNSGVYLVSHYGASEMGQLMVSWRDGDDKSWNYVRPLPSVQPYLFMDPQGDGSFECVVLEGLPAKVTSNSEDPPNSFRTSDTFLPHPSIPNAWKYLGRIDDRVTLVNGEKVLPIPIEHQVRQNELVKDALVFGVGKDLPGMLVVPSENAVGLNKSEILERVWPNIEAANSKAEGFSQISLEMVEILEVGIDYPLTDKGTMVRKASYKHFADLIEAVYRRFENADSGKPKLALSLAELISFVQQYFAHEIGLASLTRDTDFFEAGVDSLQAMKIWSYLKRELDLGESTLGQNVVFEYPNVEKLSTHLYSLRTGEQMEQENELDTMSELISKYSVFKNHVHVQEEVVLLTGTTGSLGVHILSQLLEKDYVQRIYCPVRASTTSAAFDRVLANLVSKRLSTRNLDKIIALPSDLGSPELGFDAFTLRQLQQTLTKVIHSAWAVNFNLGVRSFEQQHIRGVQNLINLCLSVQRTPAQFYFCSSISAAAGTPLPATIAEGPVPEFAHAQKMGYARSKLVAEKITQAAAEKTGMVAKVLRVGQIVGDTDHGIWNTTEAIPLMIQGATTLHALPALDETPSWLPVDKVAQAVLDLSQINQGSAESLIELNDSSVVYHVQNPRLFHWTNDLLPVLRDAGLKFETVGQREWIDRLRKSEQDPSKNPTIKLVEFFAEKYDNDRMGRKGLVFATEKTEKASETMRGGFDIIGSGLMKKIVEEWRMQW